MIEDPLSERILWKEFRVGETIIVDVGKRSPPKRQLPTTSRVRLLWWQVKKRVTFHRHRGDRVDLRRAAAGADSALPQSFWIRDAGKSASLGLEGSPVRGLTGPTFGGSPWSSQPAPTITVMAKTAKRHRCIRLWVDDAAMAGRCPTGEWNTWWRRPNSPR